jgi:lysozyme
VSGFSDEGPVVRDDHVPRVISMYAAEELLREDMNTHTDELYRALPWIQAYEAPVREAVINMAFNLGITRLLGFKGFLRELQARNYTMAAIEMLDSKWHREDVGPRAVRLAKQLVTRIRQ